MRGKTIDAVRTGAEAGPGRARARGGPGRARAKGGPGRVRDKGGPERARTCVRRTAGLAPLLALMMLAFFPAAALPQPEPPGILVKLKEDARFALGPALRRGLPSGSRASARLVELAGRFGITTARRVIPALPSPRSRLRERFAARTARSMAADREPGLSRLWVLAVPDPGFGDADQRAAEAAAAWAADPDVEYAEVDGPVTVVFTPNDPFLATSGSWGQPFNDLWGLDRIRARESWDQTTGSGVTIAILDTGLDALHEDVAANLWTNPGETPGNALDDDGNGYIDDVRGYDFADGDADPTDDHMHGTHVAGIAAAVGDNAVGIAGVAFEARLMGLRALGSSGGGTASSITEAIVYAVDNGADVLNASISGPGRSQAISDAIAYARAAGVVFIAAAGNDSASTTSAFPANDPGAIAVSAFASDDTRASFSNHGVKLDFGAPGGGDGPPPAGSLDPANSLLSLLSADGDLSHYGAHLLVSPGYARLGGTSMAAPYASGAAALLLAMHPAWNVEQIRQALRISARDVGPAGIDLDSAYGCLDVAAALSMTEPLVAHLGAPRAGLLTEHAEVEIRGSAFGPGFETWTLEVGVGVLPSTWTTLAGPTPSPVENGVLAFWPLDSVPDGEYVLRLVVRRGEEEFSDRVPVAVGNASITSPPPLAALRGGDILDIRGTAAGAGFLGYSVEWRRPGGSWTSTGIVRTSTAEPVVGDVLATFDTAAVGNADRVDLRLRVDSDAGTTEKRRSGLTVDPTLREGWPRSIVPVADHQYLTVADVNDDGTKEILVGSGDEVLVLQHDGSAHPGWPRRVTGSHPGATTTGSPIVADLDGDGRVEIVATNRHEIFAWAEDGTLLDGFPVTSAVFAGGGANLAAGDLDGDGDDEILCSGEGGSEALDGAGEAIDSWSADAQWNDSALAVADVDGDGRAESAFYHRLGSAAVARTSLALRGPDRLALDGWPRRVKAGLLHPRVGMADLDGDGSLDLLMVGEDPRRARITPRAFDADGSKVRLARFSDRALCATPGAACRTRTGNLVSFADIDGDGRDEGWLYMRTPAASASGDGFGQFLRIDAQGFGPAVPGAVHRLLQADLRFGATAIADIDGDGEQELVSGFSGEEAGATRRRAVIVADPDGTLDPAFPKPVPQLVASDGDGATIPSAEFPHFDDDRHASPAVADLDGDGLKEVVWVDPLLYQVFVWNVAGVPSPEAADWPMLHHDPRHGNALTR